MRRDIMTARELIFYIKGVLDSEYCDGDVASRIKPKIEEFLENERRIVEQITEAKTKYNLNLNPEYVPFKDSQTTDGGLFNYMVTKTAPFNPEYDSPTVTETKGPWWQNDNFKHLNRAVKMSPQDFAYWLNGFLEVSDPETINKRETQIIKDHLALVFDKVTPDRSLTDEPNICSVEQKYCSSSNVDGEPPSVFPEIDYALEKEQAENEKIRFGGRKC